jgi:hypothetical protein
MCIASIGARRAHDLIVVNGARIGSAARVSSLIRDGDAREV